jgi:hypothetical protein
MHGLATKYGTDNKKLKMREHRLIGIFYLYHGEIFYLIGTFYHGEIFDLIGTFYHGEIFYRDSMDRIVFFPSLVLGRLSHFARNFTQGSDVTEIKLNKAEL